MEDQGLKLSDKALQDYDLVQKALKGDEKAFARLLSRYKDTIYFMLLKMLNNRSDAEDLTIEAFGKAFKNLDQYSPEYAFSTWLFKIAANNCIDFMRRNRRINYVTVDNNDEAGYNNYPSNIPSLNLSPEDRVIEKQKIVLMHEVVEKLKPHYRLMVELRYFKELTYEEIASKLDLPLGTVKAQLFRAREFLYQILKNSQEKI